MDAALDVLALTLQTNAETVSGVLRGRSEGAGYSALTALAATRTLSLTVDDTMRALVSRARDEGATWQDVGDVLGTTRQAAFQRFGATSRGGSPEMTAVIENADAFAVDLLTRYFAKDWTIRESFDETMTDRLSQDLLAASHEQLRNTVGEVEALGEPTVHVQGQHTVVDVPIRFVHGEMKGRVALDGSARVAGFFVLNPDVA